MSMITKINIKKPAAMAAAGIIAFMIAMLPVLTTSQAYAASDYVIDNAGVISDGTKNAITESNDSNKNAPKVYIYTDKELPSGVTDGSALARNNDNLIRNNTEDPQNSVMLILYTDAHKISIRFGNAISGNITGYLTDGNVYNSEARQYLSSGNFDKGMRTAASNVFNYINAGAASGSTVATNQAVEQPRPISIPWKEIGVVLIGVIGIIFAGFGSLMGSASLGRSKNSRASIKLIKDNANYQRFGSETYNSRYTDEAWAAAIIKRLNENGELDDVTSKKKAKAACYNAGRAVYLEDGLQYDLSTCDYYDATVNYSDAIKDTDIEADHFNLQAVVDRVNKQAKVSAANQKRLDDAIETANNVIKGRTDLTPSEASRIDAELRANANKFLLPGTEGECKVDMDGLNDLTECIAVKMKAGSYARNYASSNAFKQEPLFNTDAFIDSIVDHAVSSGENGRILSGNMDFMDDYTANMFAKANEDAKAAKARRDKIEAERRERERRAAEERRMREKEEQRKRDEERRQRSDNFAPLASIGTGVIAGTVIGSMLNDDNDNNHHDNSFGGSDSGFSGFGGSDSSFGGFDGFDSGFDGGDFGGSDSSF